MAIEKRLPLAGKGRNREVYDQMGVAADTGARPYDAGLGANPRYEIGRLSGPGKRHSFSQIHQQARDNDFWRQCGAAAQRDLLLFGVPHQTTDDRCALFGDVARVRRVAQRQQCERRRHRTGDAG